MPAPPPYMRFFPDVYLRDTIGLTMEEQGVYMRLLCTMWTHGGKISSDDRIIVKALPIERNKWLKVKPQLMPYLCEHSPGYLTQQRLRMEYKFSAGITRALKEGAQGAAPQAARGATPQAATQATRGATSQAAQNGTADNGQEFSNDFQPVGWLPEGGVAHALARALDQSKSRSNQNKNNRFLEDGGGETCGQLELEERAARFIHEVIEAFETHRLQPPHDYDIVKGWIENGCDPFLHILKAVKATLGRHQRGSNPPKSWRYFAKEVYQLKRKEK